MRSYPFTSKVTYDSQGLPQYDRAIDSDFLRKIYANYFTDGIFYKPTTAFQVQAGTGMTVTVAAGAANIQGAIAIEDTTRELTIQASETSDRIDTVVLRLNLALDSRSIDLYIVKGAAATTPSAPALTRNSTVWELGLANLYIAANTSTITTQRITDTRLDTDRCGQVAQTIGTLDTSPYFTQVQALIDDLEKEIEGIEKGSEVMLKSVYDTDGDGIVDNAEALGGYASSSFMMKSGGTFTGNTIAYSTNRTTNSLRNIAVYDSTGATLQSTNSIQMWRK